MKALLQRVSAASVAVNGEEVARVKGGLLVLLGLSRDDTDDDARYLVDKTVHLRLFSGETGRFDLSALDTKADLLVVSQFTLCADTRRGRRPDFTAAMPPEEAVPLYERTVGMFRATGLRVETGRFREHMMVSLVNDGPVTIMLDSADRSRPRRQPNAGRDSLTVKMEPGPD